MLLTHLQLGNYMGTGTGPIFVTWVTHLKPTSMDADAGEGWLWGTLRLPLLLPENKSRFLFGNPYSL